MMSSTSTSMKNPGLKPVQTVPHRVPSPPASTDTGSAEQHFQHDERVRGRRCAFDALGTGGSAPQGDVSAGGSPGAVQDRGELGYKTNFKDLYTVEKEVGRGAFGVVTKCTHIASGRTFACKSIAKTPAQTNDPEKIVAHHESIQREVFVLKELSSCLNVAKLEEAFEDDTHVHLVLELCEGGELEHSIGKSHYSERTVASYMRAVLKLLAQCHVHNILHRDIKPGNFMLATNAEDARIKAIDFGLATPFRDGENLTDLSMQGTPWFLAPETLSSKWSPKSDVWAAGVMAHQLLTGRLPFNDKRNPYNPALSAVLRSVLTDKLDFDKAYWKDISKEGKDFVKFMLQRDPDARPTAHEALQHPWLQGDVSDRHKGKPLSFQVVQRVQRYGRNNILKRSLLSLMVSELMDDDSAPDITTSCHLDAKGRPVMDSPHAHAVASVLKYLKLDGKSEVTHADLAKGLRKMGYRLTDDELQRLMDAIGGGQTSVSRSTVIASQIDWSYLQRYQKQRWLELTRRAFDNLDVDSDGKVGIDELMRALEDRIPADELNELFAATSAPAQPGASAAVGIPIGDGNGRTISAVRPLSFQTFMSLLRQPSEESLDYYDDRYEGTVTSGRTESSAASVGKIASGYLSSGVGPTGSTHMLEGMCAAMEAAGLSEAPTPPSAKSQDRSFHRDKSRHGRDLQTVFERTSVNSQAGV